MATERLPLLVGRGRTLEIVLGANDFDGDTAERYGYVNRALPDAELDGFVDVLAGASSRKRSGPNFFWTPARRIWIDKGAINTGA